MKKTNGWWRLWHGGTGMFPVYLLICMTTFFAGEFFLTNLVRKTNKRRMTMPSQTPTVFDQRPHAQLQRAEKQRRQQAIDE